MFETEICLGNHSYFGPNVASFDVIAFDTLFFLFFSLNEMLLVWMCLEQEIKNGKGKDGP